MKKTLTATASLLLALNVAQACSNVAINATGNTVVARTLDFEQNTGNVMALGLPGQSNISNTNLTPQAQAYRWVTQYAFLGQSGYKNPNILDGMNDCGVYVGYFYLPGITHYPAYKSQGKPALGITDVANYLLGTSSSVDDALNQLKKVQLVANGIAVDAKHEPGVYEIMPIHILIRDNHGDSAVIEFIKGHTVVHHPAGAVLTNAPDFNWQRNNAKKYNYTTTNNTNQQVDGLYMNGSGFEGIPGDWTPPGRFARATQVLKHFPHVYTNAQAMTLAQQALATVEVPLGVNPSPTIWESIANLHTHDYYFRALYNITDSTSHTYQVVDNGMPPWQVYHLDKIAATDRLPKGWVSAEINHQAPLIKLLNMMQATPGKQNPAPNPHLAK